MKAAAAVVVEAAVVVAKAARHRGEQAVAVAVAHRRLATSRCRNRLLKRRLCFLNLPSAVCRTGRSLLRFNSTTTRSSGFTNAIPTRWVLSLIVLDFVKRSLWRAFNRPSLARNRKTPVHTVKLGDDLRKVMNRYGYPDDIVVLANDPQTITNPTRGDSSVVAAGQSGGGGGGAAAGERGAGGADAGGRGGGGSAEGGGGGAGAGGGGNGLPGSVGGISRSLFTTPVLNPEETQSQVLEQNATYRTFDLRYDQSYNAVFTIRNNRVVRMYIFGDPDFFNAQRRNALRTRY